MINELIDRGAAAIGKMLPARKFNIVREPYLYFCLSRIICEAELFEDGSFFLRLNNGLKFYAQQGRGFHRSAKYAHSRNFRKLKKLMKDIPAVSALSHELFNQYIRDLYQRYYKIKTGDTVIVLGAHVGLFTVKAARAAGDEGMVVAVEPEPDNVSFLRRNIEANQLKTVAIIEKGVWSTKDRLRFFIAKDTRFHSFLELKDAMGFVEVEVDTLDNMLRELGIKKVDFIKMDIEGAEIEALKGMNETLKGRDVKLATEAHGNVGGEPSWKSIASWLKRSGFQIHVKGDMVYGMKKS